MYFEEKAQEREKNDFYLAQIAFEVRKIYKALTSDKAPLAIKDLLLDFGTTEPEPPAKKKKMSKKAKEAAFHVANATSKSFWLGSLGLDLEGKPLGRNAVGNPPGQAGR